MEEKLKEFKSRRRREILLSKPKNFFKGIVDKFSFKSESPPNITEDSNPLLSQKTTPEKSLVREDDENSILSVASSVDSSITIPSMSWITVSIYFSYFLLWVITYLMAIHLEFGYVYLICSGLVFIYFNTRTEPKKEGEVSAYSVFNPGCESIQGTLKAEQFEREFNLIKHEPVTPDK